MLVWDGMMVVLLHEPFHSANIAIVQGEVLYLACVAKPV